MKTRRRIVAENAVRITFKGPGVDDGSIDARQLGRSLVGISDAFQTARSITCDPESPQTSVRITATGEGSFWVDITLVADSTLVQATIDALSGKAATAAANLTAILTVAFGAIAFIKKKAGKVVKASRPLPSDPDKTEIVYDDSTTEVVDSAVWNVAKNTNFQKAAKESLKAVTAKGIDQVQLSPQDRTSGIPAVSVKKADYSSFVRIDNEPDELVDKTEELLVSPLSISFEDGKRWRLTDGDSTFSAFIEDEDFLSRIDNGLVRIGKNDNFKVLMRVEQKILPDKSIRTTRTVLQILDYIKGGEQGELFEL